MAINHTLISVIVPSFNRADSVGKTIESILNQQVDSDIEIVIGDDCSTDKVRDLLEDYRKRYPEIIRLFLRSENIGLGANWAQCVKDCRGEFICNCDDDDYWHNPNKLQLQLDYYREHSGCNILITDHRTEDYCTGIIAEHKAYINKDVDIQEAMWGSATFCNATIMYRAEFLKAHLDLDEFVRRRFSLQDWPALVILTAYSDVDILPVSTATHVVGKVGITRPDTVEMLANRFKDDKKVFLYLMELFPEKFPYDEIYWNRYVNGRLMSKAFDLGQFDVAKRYGKECNNIGRIKRICSQNRLLFELYVWVKKMKRFC